MATKRKAKSRSRSSRRRTSRSKTARRTSRRETIKRLYRSGKDRILGGVCGGIAEYLNVDPTVIRILWILFTLAYGAGLIAYLIAWMVIPRNPKHKW